MALNIHTFPLVPYPGRAPELAPLSGMGSWEPYALLAPADRLLPFVLTRALLLSQGAWVNCARIEHADTGALVIDLVPTGQGVAVPALGLTLAKYQDVAAGVEHFAYLGALVPGLALPCGVPLRLILDNAWQSPRFLARADLDTTCLLAEWWHDFPLYRVPYGAGLRQHFYLENAALHYAPTATKQEVTTDAATGVERIDYLAQYRAATVSTEAVPPYLAEALSAARAHHRFTLDGEKWRIEDTKDTVAGSDGGRSTLVLDLQQTDVLIRRNCPAPVPVPLAFVAGSVRPWRCGVASDTAPDFQRTGAYACALDSSGRNTGQATFTEKDLNPYSATFNTTRPTALLAAAALCPVPYFSHAVSGLTTRNNCPSGQDGAPVTYTVPAGQFTSVISQADANGKADAFYAATKQANANANGTCTVGDAQYKPRYLPDGCFSDQMVNRADPNDVRDATADEHTRYFRATVGGLACPE